MTHLALDDKLVSFPAPARDFSSHFGAVYFALAWAMSNGEPLDLGWKSLLPR